MSFIGSKREKPELIVVLLPELASLLLSSGTIPATHSLSTILERRQIELKPVAPRHGSLAPLALANPRRQKLDRYFFVETPEDASETMRAELAADPSVETAYIKPPAELASLGAHGVSKPAVLAQANTKTPDFTPRQLYLDPAPVGIDARYAWTLPGGKGDGIRIVDCESDWNTQHEDLTNRFNGILIGTIDPNDDDRHGTCVAGVMVANENEFGITGIAPNATLGRAVFAANDQKVTSAVIVQAADLLSAGDILLLEIHRPGPRAPSPLEGQKGYIAIEWWPDDFDAISYATSKGIVVVEAAGNGREDLDHPAYSVPLADFPNGWRNPFSDQTRNSDAILVGAGMPPPGTHGRTKDEFWHFGETYFDRARCIFSNFGKRIDCQGWGYEVTSLSLGDLFQGNNGGVPDNNRVYTDVFAGTSSASPIVAGAVACMQGVLRAEGRPPLAPSEVRKLLRELGSPQQVAPGRPTSEQIGSRPDLRAILFAVLA